MASSIAAESREASSKKVQGGTRVLGLGSRPSAAGGAIGVLPSRGKNGLPVASSFPSGPVSEEETDRGSSFQIRCGLGQILENAFDSRPRFIVR